MENYTPTYSLLSIADKKSTDSFRLNGLTYEDMESSIKELLLKNSDLSRQLQKALSKISRLKKQRSALLDVIVKVNKSQDSEEDCDSELSAGDLSSDFDSDDSLTSNNKKAKLSQPTDYVPVYKRKKSRQRQTKAINIPKNDKGGYDFPVLIGRTTLLSLGEIIPNVNFYNQNYIFPVGFKTQRGYKSMVNIDKYTTYTCSIEKDNEDKPLFCLEAEDAPDIIIKKPTPTAAWSEVLKRSNLLRNKRFKNTVSGPEYYGLSSGTIKKMIQELPGANECIGYQWVNL